MRLRLLWTLSLFLLLPALLYAQGEKGERDLFEVLDGRVLPDEAQGKHILGYYRWLDPIGNSEERIRLTDDGLVYEFERFIEFEGEKHHLQGRVLLDPKTYRLQSARIEEKLADEPPIVREVERDGETYRETATFGVETRSSTIPVEKAGIYLPDLLYLFVRIAAPAEGEVFATSAVNVEGSPYPVRLVGGPIEKVPVAGHMQKVRTIRMETEEGITESLALDPTGTSLLRLRLHDTPLRAVRVEKLSDVVNPLPAPPGGASPRETVSIFLRSLAGKEEDELFRVLDFDALYDKAQEDPEFDEEIARKDFVDLMVRRLLNIDVGQSPESFAESKLRGATVQVEEEGRATVLLKNGNRFELRRAERGWLLTDIP